MEMTVYKVILRDFLGLIVIMSVVLATLGLLLDFMVVFAYFSNEQSIAGTFFHESFYLLAFIVPAYFIVKYINNTQMVVELEAYLLAKDRSEHF